MALVVAMGVALFALCCWEAYRQGVAGRAARDRVRDPWARRGADVRSVSASDVSDVRVGVTGFQDGKHR